MKFFPASTYFFLLFFESTSYLWWIYVASKAQNSFKVLILCVVMIFAFFLFFFYIEFFSFVLFFTLSTLLDDRSSLIPAFYIYMLFYTFSIRPFIHPDIYFQNIFLFLHKAIFVVNVYICYFFFSRDGLDCCDVLWWNLGSDWFEILCLFLRV